MQSCDFVDVRQEDGLRIAEGYQGYKYEFVSNSGQTRDLHLDSLALLSGPPRFGYEERMVCFQFGFGMLPVRRSETTLSNW
jgi:hypothetical protein